MSASPVLQYPVTRRADNKDDYFGQSIADPWRWLENPDDPEVAAWVTQQNEVTQTFLKTCSTKEQLEKRLKDVYNYERFSCPFRRGPWILYYHNSGLQNQSVLFKQRGLDGKNEVLLDPNTLSSDGTAALGVVSVTEDGSLMAYGVSRSGSDWTSVSVLRLEDNKTLEDELHWVKFSGLSWTHDNKGFFYSRYPKPAELASTEADVENSKRGTETSAVRDHMVYYHRLGTPQSEDLLVHRTPDNPEWTLGATVSEDGLWLMLEMSDGCDTKNRLYVARLNDDNSYTAEVQQRIVKLIDVFNAQYEYINNEGDRFWFRTNYEADNYRVVSFRATIEEATKPETWKTIVPSHPRDVLQSVRIAAHDKLIVEWSRDVQGVLSLSDLEGNVIVDQFKLPDVGDISGISARKKDTTFFYLFTSFLYPGIINAVDLSKPRDEQQTLFREIRIQGINPSDFTTVQEFYDSKGDTGKDPARIPMFIVHRKGMKLDGNNPTWMYGYGGFNISLPPSFSVARLVWMAHFGGVFACPNIRGGGEYGEQWRKGGILQRKKNCFADFIAAGEHLIASGYTSPSKLAISGGSNGGLLVSACLNQRPDLFACVVGQVGVLDMLKFHTWTIGHAWASDYGNSAQSEEMFKYLLSYSPVHNVREDAPYPALMLCTSDHDDRVVPLHSYKFISEVQSKVAKHAAQKAPLLIRVEEKAGHGAGLPLSKRIVEQADTISFMAKALGAEGKF